MTLSDPRPLLAAARSGGYAIGAFNVIQIEHAEAIVAGAEQAGLPVVLQVSENTAAFHRGLAGIGAASLAIAAAATVPVVVHLDHAESEDLIDQAVALGFTSVMFDGAKLDYADNQARTADVVARCHAAGVAVEAELGEVGGKDGAHAPGVRTDPIEAAAFVAATGVDSLAVAVGTSHAMANRSAQVDLELVRSLRAGVPVPLVLHGSSGVDDPGLVTAVRAGMTKVNIATRLNQVMTAVVREVLAENPGVTDPRKYLGPGRDAVANEVALLLRLLRG
ncbi:fructose-bisphosphate aldolase, class II [Nakamurella panacisegetis]|uniref:Fructose-bisphosphate aldolase, class II n=1 Tax=Nakamurella panacisegetis TaxID=1090615 RepID=A0A1H0JCT9_9ACTN|nr:class II fructose-bisphosphate aldolase [Nakamurella panacisegetis]SDO41360.1 fructose-bisphosphate aldolase, class II [Nakamurella panacisegetis]